MNTGYNNFNTPSLNGLVDITADNISSTSITVSDLTLENSLNVVELNFSDNINGITTSEFSEIPNITNNHTDIVSLQDKTQNIILLCPLSIGGNWKPLIKVELISLN
jgi:hypothetical protein